MSAICEVDRSIHLSLVSHCTVNASPLLITLQRTIGDTNMLYEKRDTIESENKVCVLHILPREGGFRWHKPLLLASMSRLTELPARGLFGVLSIQRHGCCLCQKIRYWRWLNVKARYHTILARRLH